MYAGRVLDLSPFSSCMAWHQMHTSGTALPIMWHREATPRWRLINAPMACPTR